jgi:hypothetical protein
MPGTRPNPKSPSRCVVGVAMDYPSPDRALIEEGSVIGATPGAPGTDGGVVERSAGAVGRIPWARQGLLLTATARHLPIGSFTPITRRPKTTHGYLRRLDCRTTAFRATDAIADTGVVPRTEPSAAPNTATPLLPAGAASGCREITKRWAPTPSPRPAAGANPIAFATLKRPRSVELSCRAAPSGSPRARAPTSHPRRRRDQPPPVGAARDHRRASGASRDHGDARGHHVRDRCD